MPDGREERFCRRCGQGLEAHVLSAPPNPDDDQNDYYLCPDQQGVTMKQATVRVVLDEDDYATILDQIDALVGSVDGDFEVVTETVVDA